MASPLLNASTSQRTSTPTAVRVPHTRVRLGRSKNVIYSTYQHVIELYGPQLPVLVAESLHYTPGAKTTASVNLNTENAWAWYVCGRKLLVWHIPSYSDSGLTVIAKEMLLPSSDLAHNANLVSVFIEPKQIAPSCIAVSPEGMIRYWEVMGHHSTWVDVNANLGGEEVCGVYYIPPIGCLAVTTSGTMIIITPTVVRGMATVVTRHVSQMPGWFDNIGRRVSSIIFGGAKAQLGLESKTVKVLTSVRLNGYWTIFLLAGFSLNSWAIQIEGVVCNHLYECNLEPIIRKAFPEGVTENPGCELIITDIRLSEGGNVVALVVSSSPRYYIIVELNGNDIDPPDTATRMCILSQNNVSVLEGAEGKIVPLQFLLLPTTALIFNNVIIFAVPLSGGEEADGEPLDLPGGVVLGGLMHKTTPVFFSATYGFVSITPVNTGCIDVLNTSVVDTRVTPRSIAAREPVSSTTVDYVSHLKVAFIHYIRNNLHQCLQVIKKEFPIEDGEGIDSVFATTLIKVSLDIINDLSSKDHRWGEVRQSSLMSGTMSLHLDTQLAEKKQAHDIFLKFAKDISSTINLGRVTRKGTTVRTIHILYEHNEKIIACLLLKKLQKRFPKAIGHCVGVAAYEMNFVPTQTITSADFFFRYVSIVDEGIKAIISKCVRLSYHNLGSVKFTKLLVTTNSIITVIFNTILRIRTKKGYFIDPTYVPWLSAPEPTGLFDHLSNLAQVTYDALSRFGKQSRRYKKIVNQFFYICNIILYIQLPHLEKSEFNVLSSSIIEFFLDFEMHFQGLQLAYKYKNFEYLIKLAYLMKRESQIMYFVQEFGDEGFCFYLFKYLYLDGKYQELLNLELPEQYIQQLETFLQDFPVLNWLYQLKTQDYQKANQILMSLNSIDNVTLKDQEIMFSMAKLTALAGACPDLSQINNNIEIINAQKNIPEVVFTRKGYDTNFLKMLTPSELIELFTGEENFEGDEFDFKKALELLKFVDNSAERENLRRKVWRRAIEKDDWEGTKIDFTPEIVDEFLLFKLMKLLKSEDNFQSLIPPVEELIEDPELEIFSKDSLSSYLLEYGYEQIMGVERVPFEDAMDYLSK